MITSISNLRQIIDITLKIQGLMGASGFKQCDFVIFTTKDLQIVPVAFNTKFWKDMK
jgi:hypothetical protein